jgi:RNA polymerase sigma-70 factor (ECF subfamily)
MPQANSFTEMLISHLPRLRAYAIGLTRNHAAADDLVQETAFRVLRAESQFMVGTNFTAWTYRILKNSFLSSLRRAKRTPSQIDDLGEDVLATPGRQEGLVFTREVIQAMHTLPRAQLQVLMLVCADGLSYGEAATTAQTTVGTIKSRLWRGRKKMESLTMGADFLPQTGRTDARTPMREHA